MVNPNLEAIVALRPDLVIATTEGNREETFAQLKRLGIPTYLVAAHHVRDVTDLIARLGALTGYQQAAGPLLARLERRVAAVTDAVARLPRPRVLYVLGPEPLVVPGREALGTELIQLAGGDSVTAADADAWPRYSLEAAVAKLPEVILLANHGANTGPIDEERWRRLTSLPAIRDGRLRRVDGNLLHRYGPRVVDGLSGGAAFGVVIGQSFGLGLTVLEAMGLTSLAFAGALLAAAAVYVIAAAGRGMIQIQTLLLAGVIVGIFFSAAITVIISLLDVNRLGGVIYWLLGNLAPIPPGALALFASLLQVRFGLVLSHARELNLLALGEESAH